MREALLDGAGGLRGAVLAAVGGGAHIRPLRDRGGITQGTEVEMFFSSFWILEHIQFNLKSAELPMLILCFNFLLKLVHSPAAFCQ